VAAEEEDYLLPVLGASGGGSGEVEEAVIPHRVFAFPHLQHTSAFVSIRQHTPRIAYLHFFSYVHVFDQAR
jgi:hypothetical protein